jgi:hypothetical protein
MSRRPSPFSLKNRLLLLRRGVVLALLALVSQTILTILPATAEAQARPGGIAICGMAMPGDQGSHGGKSVPHSMPDCPVCQAFHLAANLVPPAPPPTIFERRVHGWRALPVTAVEPARFDFQPQQARAPPSV